MFENIIQSFLCALSVHKAPYRAVETSSLSNDALVGVQQKKFTDGFRQGVTIAVRVHVKCHTYIHTGAQLVSF